MAAAGVDGTWVFVDHACGALDSRPEWPGCLHVETGHPVVATSSFAIRELRRGQLSLLHVLSVVTLRILALGIIGGPVGKLRPAPASMRGSWFDVVGPFVGAAAVPGGGCPSSSSPSRWAR